jgi:nitrate reductase NapA
VQVLYGPERITRAMVRRDGQLVPAPLSEALDLVAKKLKETRERYGKDSVAMYGSAQWAIADAYVAAKLFKGALGTNNIDTSTRLYSASAVAGHRSSFGLDGSVGCYDDIDHADVLVLWDTNLAESDPVLFSRMLDRKRSDPAVRIIDITTRTTRTSYASDHSLLHAPHAALAIAMAYVRRSWRGSGFSTGSWTSIAFKRGPESVILTVSRRRAGGRRELGGFLTSLPDTDRSVPSGPASPQPASAGWRRCTATRSGR